MGYRYKTGDFRRVHEKRKPKQDKRIKLDHNYTNTSVCLGNECNSASCFGDIHIKNKLGKGIGDGWREGRRLIELGVLVKNLQYCQSCKLGPVPLTVYNVVGELQKGLSGYLYVMCQNADCNYINRVAYGKLHHIKKGGMPCFDGSRIVC